VPPCAAHRDPRAAAQILLNGNNVCMLVPGGDGPVSEVEAA
jgi:hypothetical protein